MGYESAYTSLNQVPACFKTFKLGYLNFDIGGGKFDTGTNYLNKHGTKNITYDPNFDLPPEKESVLLHLSVNEVDSITCNNVLNVIQDANERKEIYKTMKLVLKTQKAMFKNVPVIIFQIYEGDRSGKPSTKTVQNNMKTATYIPEIQAAFPGWEVQRQGNFLIV